MYNIQPKTEIIGKIHTFVPSCHSTNDLALEIIQNTANFHGTVILSAFQTAGRGQKGNTWESESGRNLIFSVALDTSFLKVDEQFYLSMAMSLAVIDTLNTLGMHQTAIKWPNDIFIQDKKVGGMLIENKSRGEFLRSSVLGIGINVFQEIFESERASSLVLNGLEVGVTLNTIVEMLCQHIEVQFDILSQKHFADIHQAYLNIIYKIGQEQVFEQAGRRFSAIIRHVDANGRLVLLHDGQERKYQIQELKYVF